METLKNLHKQPISEKLFFARSMTTVGERA